MNENDKTERINYYNKRMEKYGESPKALGWFKGRQELRYNILTSIGGMDNSSILDVGCGFGDFKIFLDTKFVISSYLGIDINPELVNIARKRHPNSRFDVLDIDEINNPSFKFDWVFACGVFEYKTKNTYDFIKSMILKMYEISNQGVAVDFLSDIVDFESENAFHANPEEIIKIAKSISPRFTIKHDYMRFEFTLYLYKDLTKSERHVYTQHEIKTANE